jgi:phage tail sheath protein FI
MTAIPNFTAPGVYVVEVASGNAPIVGAGTSTAAFIGAYVSGVQNVPDPGAGVIVACTSFTDFKNAFGDVNARLKDNGFIYLSQAVYGFFLNGGTRCYVVRIAAADGGAWVQKDFQGALDSLEAYEDISIVAAPGMVTPASVSALTAHCHNMQDRIAILDTPPAMTVENVNPSTPASAVTSPPTPPTTFQDIYSFTNGDFAALYYPWIGVAHPDPNAKDPTLFVPPSGHMAGIYARVDASRGVHKAPANEAVFGAIRLQTLVTRNQQQSLNPDGVNCIRRMNSAILVWGGRTLGGEKSLNPDVRYVNVRRLLNYLRDSIQNGTRWTVFEPNGPDLWARVIRNVSAFLKQVWSAGGLFGATPQQAFYVKCDAENNPKESRDQGNLVIEIGVAVTKPAEFVVFYLSQWAPPQAS